MPIENAAAAEVENVNPATAGNENNAGGGGEAVVVNPVQLKDEDLVEVIVDGKPERLAWKDARAGVQRQADYTRKTQSLSAREKELQSIYDTVVAKQKEVSDREALLDTVLGRVKPNQPKTHDSISDDEVIVGKQVKEILAAKERELETRFDTKLDAKLREFGQQTSQAATFQRWDDMTNTAVEQLTKEHPVLSKLPELPLTLKKMAAKEAPTNDRELVQAIVRAGQSLAKTLDEAYEERAKARSAEKQRRLVDTAPQRPGGGVQLETPKKTYTQGRKVQWDKLERDVEAALEDQD